MSKQHSNAAGENAAIGKIQYRLLEFSMDYAGFVYSETNMMMNPAASASISTRPAVSFAEPKASRSWAVSTSTAVSGQRVRNQATVSAGRWPGNAWSSSSTCGRSSSISRSASPPGDCLSARSRNAYSAGPGYREGCLHGGASVRGVQLTFWVSSIRSAQPMPVGPPVHPMRYASTSSRCSDQVLVLSTQS